MTWSDKTSKPIYKNQLHSNSYYFVTIYSNTIKDLHLASMITACSICLVWLPSFKRLMNSNCSNKPDFKNIFAGQWTLIYYFYFCLSFNVRIKNHLIFNPMPRLRLLLQCHRSRSRKLIKLTYLAYNSKTIDQNGLM